MATPPSGDFDDRPLKFYELCSLLFRHYEDAKIKLKRETGEEANAAAVAQANMRTVSALNRLFFDMAIDVGTVFGNLLDPIYRHLEGMVLPGSIQQQQTQQQQLISEQPTQHQQVDSIFANGKDEILSPSSNDSAELPASEAMLPMPDNLSEDPHMWQKMAHHLVQMSQSPIIDSLAGTNVLPQQPPPSPAYEQARDMPVLPDSISSVAAAPVPLVASVQAFPCPADNCDKVYKLKSTLKWHSNIYHPAQHRCTWPECTYSSPNMGTTLMHIEKIHLQEIPNREHGKAAIRAQAQSYIEVIPLDGEARQRWISESLQLARTRRANSKIARRQPKRLATAKGGPKQCKSERFEN